MKKIIMFLMTLSMALALNVHESLSDPTLEARARFLYKNMLCPSCGGQTLDDSPSEIAEQMRASIREGLTGGLSDGDVVDMMQERYGSHVSLMPSVQEGTLVLWVLPWGLFMLGSFFVVRRIKR